jgi:hypothetical protein
VRRAAAIAAIVYAVTLAAQEPDPHAALPERPTVATHAHTVAAGWIEIESGLLVDRLDGGQVFSTPTTLKLGLARRVQVELTSAWLRQSDGAINRGVSGVTVALKWRLADSLPVLGAFAVQPALRLPTGSAAIAANATVGTILLISSHQLGGIALDINAGVSARLGARGNVPSMSTLWTVSAGLPVHGALGWSAETFGYPGTGGAAGVPPAIGLLTGPTFAARPWLVFDAGLIVPLAGPQPHSVYAGMTWNLGRLWHSALGARL